MARSPQGRNRLEPVLSNPPGPIKFATSVFIVFYFSESRDLAFFCVDPT